MNREFRSLWMRLVELRACVAFLVPRCLLFAAFPALAVPVHLRTEQMTSPIGVDVEKPVFSWQSDATTPDWKQSAYQIKVASAAGLLAQGKGDVWDSGRISASDSVNIPYGGPALRSQRRYFWTVQTW